MVPRENKNNAYAKFEGKNKEYYSIFRSGLLNSHKKETKKKKTQGFDRTAQNHDYYIAVIAPTPTHRTKGDRVISLKPLSSMSWKFTIILLLPFKRPFL